MALSSALDYLLRHVAPCHTDAKSVVPISRRTGENRGGNVLTCECEKAAFYGARRRQAMATDQSSPFSIYGPLTSCARLGDLAAANPTLLTSIEC